MCSEAVVQEFAKVTHHLNIMYCYPLFQVGSRAATPDAGPHPKPFSEVVGATLDTHFPFDPIAFLPRSKQYVAGQFQEWEDGDEGSNMAESDLSHSLNGMSLENSFQSY